MDTLLSHEATGNKQSNRPMYCKSLAKGELYIQANKYLFEISTVSYKQKSIHT